MAASPPPFIKSLQWEEGRARAGSYHRTRTDGVEHFNAQIWNFNKDQDWDLSFSLMFSSFLIIPLVQSKKKSLSDWWRVSWRERGGADGWGGGGLCLQMLLVWMLGALQEVQLEGKEVDLLSNRWLGVCSEARRDEGTDCKNGSGLSGFGWYPRAVQRDRL